AGAAGGAEPRRTRRRSRGRFRRRGRVRGCWPSVGAGRVNPKGVKPMSTGLVDLERTPDDCESVYPEDWRRLLLAARDHGWEDREARQRASVGSESPPADLTASEAA